MNAMRTKRTSHLAPDLTIATFTTNSLSYKRDFATPTLEYGLFCHAREPGRRSDDPTGSSFLRIPSSTRGCIGRNPQNLARS